MLKSIDFMERLNQDLLEGIETKNINNFFIELRINQKVNVYIVSDKAKNKDGLPLINIAPAELENKNISFTFLTTNQSQDDDYSYLFEGEKVSLGLRRSLSALLNTENRKHKEKHNILTFFSYKGGVGRTTSLALTATYLSRKGKKVFVMDCDFEAPGLINFFNSSQSDKHKSGLVEYLNDQLFTQADDIEEYVYNIEKSYSGSGTINLMPSGNVLSNDENLENYLEGLAKIDLQGLSLIDIFDKLIGDIQVRYQPDIILVDSRTGFNNIFGALVKLSKHVVVLAGDDTQNQPGIEYVSNLLSKTDVNASFILSILSSNYSRRYNNFVKQIQAVYKNDADVFYFDRHSTLEFIGTSLGDKYDLDDFINGESGSTQYQKFFKYIEETTSSTTEIEVEIKENKDNAKIPIKETNASIEKNKIQNITLQDKVIKELECKLPALYAETIDYNESYINNDFFVRPCMEDFLIPEKNILLGDKGTGKTAFYKALQIDSFFDKLENKAQKKHLKYQVLNVTNYENDNFETLNFDNYIKDELFIKKFWVFFIWNAICGKRGKFESSYNEFIIDLSKLNAKTKIINLINDDELFSNIEEEIIRFNTELKLSDRRLIITFDRLDNIVKPYLWNDIISPLVKLCMRFPWDYIHPKLFLRRDLYERLGNLTNKSSFNTRIINLEWSQNEMFSYFLKIIFTYCKNDFFNYLEKYSSSEIHIKEIKQKLKTKNIEHNQLPLDTYLIQPIINLFFGDPKPRRNGKVSTAYEDLYRNIQSADQTINLRPFLDLIANAIKEQSEQDPEKNFRKDSILGLAYCTSKQVRKNAVIQYLKDLWNEQGNEFVKFFCQDISNNKVKSSYKKNVLSQDVFEQLLIEIKTLHKDDESIKNSTLEELKQILIANKIITPYMVGNKTRYGFAYLYTNYFGI